MIRFKNKLSLLSFFLLMSTFVWAQTPMKTYTGGHQFTISLPEYMKRTVGLNSAASIQFKDVVKDVYGFVIEDTKEELALAEMFYPTASAFYQDFIKDFLTDQDKRKVSKEKVTAKGMINFVESDLTYFDKEAKVEIYYLVGIVETKNSFYKVLSFCAASEKDKFKSDFQQILYSLTD